MISTFYALKNNTMPLNDTRIFYDAYIMSYRH